MPKKLPAVVMGIDPGIAKTGWGVIEESGNGMYRVAGCGVISTQACQPFHQRLKHIYLAVEGIIRQYRPVCVAVEELFFASNVKTAIHVGEARGVVLLAVSKEDTAFAEYTPLQVKQALVGYGRAPKQQMQRMVQALLRMEKPPTPDDMADALAVALCHLHSFRVEDLYTSGL